MKILLNSIALLCLISTNVFAQTYPPCSEITYAYIDKSMIPLTVRCSSSGPPYPLSDTQANMPLMLCLDPDLDLSDGRYREKVCDPTMFKERTKAALQNAIDSWMSVCMGGEVDIRISIDQSDCDVPIRPIIDEKDFTDIRNAGGRIPYPRIPFAQGWPGGLDIKGTYHDPIIQLAFTKTVYEDHEYGNYTEIGVAWSVSGCDHSTGSALCPGEKNKRCIDMETVLLHEMGHILGIGHPQEDGCVPHLEKPYPSNDAMTSVGFGERRTLSRRDECALCAIYCANECDKTASIINDEMESEYMIYPNPAGDVVNIMSRKSKNLRGVKVIDAVGRVLVQSENLANLRVVAISLEKLISGTYFLVIESENDIAVKVFKVQKLSAY